MTSRNPKHENEFRVFNEFIKRLVLSYDYNQLSNSKIKHSDSPDFEISDSDSSNEVIAIELTRYNVDGTLIERKGRHKIESKQRIATEKKIKAGLEVDTGGYYGIGEELGATIRSKAILCEKNYKLKDFSKYWLVIYSDNEFPYEFLGNAELAEILLYKCNKVMNEISHPFQKIFLFCNEPGGRWICELSTQSKLLMRDLV